MTLSQKIKNAKLLGQKVLPLVCRDTMSASYASSVLHGVSNMHNSCHMNYQQTNLMVERAIKKLRKDNKEQEWRVEALYSDGSFQLKSDYGYIKDFVSRKEFRVCH